MNIVARSLALSLALAIPTLSIARLAFAQTTLGPGASPSTSGNESTTDQRALAEMLFFTGKGMIADGRIAQACQKFAESYRLDPAAGTLLNLAVCHEREGKLATSWGEFRQARADARRAGRDDRADLAEEAIRRIEPELPFVTIRVPEGTRVDGLEIQRNLVPLQSGAWDTELPIDPGTNEILVTAPLYLPERKTITIDKKQHVSVTIDPLKLAPVERPPPPFWTPQRKLGAGLIAGGAVLAAVGAIFGARALAEKSASDGDCPRFDGQLRCTPTGSTAMSTAQTDSWVADIGVGVGSAAILAGGAVFALGRARREEKAPALASQSSEASLWDFRVVRVGHGAEALFIRSF